MPNLSIKNIEVKYEGIILGVRNVSLELPRGKTVALLGANGAGKSTTLKAISGLLHTENGKVSRGAILLDDKRIEALDTEDIASMGIVQVIEGRRLFAHLTVEQNLITGGYMLDRIGCEERLGMIYEIFPNLRRLRRNVSGYLSGGEQQMLVTGRALMARPKILMLDEPSLGLAPAMIRATYEKLIEIKERENISILLAEQNATMALGICDYAYVLETGRVVLDGSAQKLRENKDIQEFYLGLGEFGSRKSYAEVKHYRRRKRWM
jgi:branched-chain amino acid transport system ATP-binding protein